MILVLNVEDSDPTKNVTFSTDQENEARGLGENRTFQGEIIFRKTKERNKLEKSNVAVKCR